MPQRFYIKNWDHDDRWYVFMGDEAMEAAGRGLLVADVAYLAVAERTRDEYTKVFNQMVVTEAWYK